MWIARDKGGELYSFINYPEREYRRGVWIPDIRFVHYGEDLYTELKPNLFTYLTWNDSPLWARFIRPEWVKNWIGDVDS